MHREISINISTLKLNLDCDLLLFAGLLAINRNGIHLITDSSREWRMTVPFDRIAEWGYNSKVIVFSVGLEKEKLVLATPLGKHIARLASIYSKQLLSNS